jgi:hypothetical protein
MNVILQKVLDFPPVSRIRRNHALEHATLHVLAKKYPQKNLAGYSDLGGIHIFGQVPAEDVQTAVLEALDRLRRGESHLAVHAGCGTNYAVGGIFAGLAGALAMAGTRRNFRDTIERLPMAAVLGVLALIVSQPLAATFQSQVTTANDPRGMEVVQITTVQRGDYKVHHISTRG